MESPVNHVMSHNQRVKAFLRHVESQLGTMTTSEHVEEAAKGIEEFARHTRIRLRIASSVLLALLCGVAVAAGLIVASMSPDREDLARLLPWVPLAVGLIVLLISFRAKRGRIKRTSDALLWRSVLIRNNLTPANYSGRNLWAQWVNEFADFNRGNESQCIDCCYNGHYDQDEIAFDYELYRFHYVVVTRRTVTEYNSATQRNETKEVEERQTYYRYGIVCDFPYASGLSISGIGGRLYGTPWQTSSDRFNKLFRVTADSTMTAAKTLQPAVVIALEKLGCVIQAMDVQINRNSRLCLSSNCSAILPGIQRISMTKTDRFLRALRNPPVVCALQETLRTVAAIRRFNENCSRKAG